MRNLFNIVIVSIFVFLASSCQRTEITPNQPSDFVLGVSANRTEVLTAPTGFLASNIANQNITFTWNEQQGAEGYILEIYTNEGTLLSSYSLDSTTHQYTVNEGEGSFKALLKRDCGNGNISVPAETEATACCGSAVGVDDGIDRFIQSGQSACLSQYGVESYILNSTQSVTQLTHTIYSASPDYLVIYGFTNTENGTPTTYSMIPMSNILTVNTATSMRHTLQLDFQGSAYCKVYFIPWNLANCSVL